MVVGTEKKDQRIKGRKRTVMKNVRLSRFCFFMGNILGMDFFSRNYKLCIGGRRIIIMFTVSLINTPIPSIPYPSFSFSFVKKENWSKFFEFTFARGGCVLERDKIK